MNIKDKIYNTRLTIREALRERLNYPIESPEAISIRNQIRNLLIQLGNFYEQDVQAMLQDVIQILRKKK